MLNQDTQCRTADWNAAVLLESVPTGERELLSRARAGDREAQAVLYEQYIYGSASIRSLLRRGLPQEADSDDLLHEIFLAVIQGAGEFRGDSRLSTYLFRIAQLKLLESYRTAN